MGRKRAEEAYAKALTLGGKAGLNCVAELDPAYSFPEDPALPLYGVPVLVKDNVDVKGLHTTAGSLALADNLAAEDAPVVGNLRRNGAAVIGKTNLTEFANYVDPAMPAGYSSRGGQVLPAIPGAYPGGSSTGSAVAVAAGIVPMAVGTDTSHSVTACAKFNGICGLKPPAGALSRKGIVPIAATLDSAGALAASFGDALRLRAAMGEGFEAPEPLPPGKLRLAVNTANGAMLPADEADFLRRTVEGLRAAGGTVEELSQPRYPELATIMKYEFRPSLEAYLQTSAASRKTLAEILAFYEAHPDAMMKYGISLLREALEQTPGGLGSPEYREALRTRAEAVTRVTGELAGFDAAIMSGPTNVMHFCGLPSATVASSEKDGKGVNRALILYGADEYRLYSAALALEGLLRA
ncbi:MAG: hypothetical protein IKP17_04525 [Oscillospiraceae bacterium]|nr:hypothetical protein [Oscillospiraceae bacterium]